MASIQYLDELFAAIRDTAEQLATADSWMSRAEGSAHSHWRMSFLQAARRAHDAARTRHVEATSQLAALGPPDRLPSLFAGLPKRLDELDARLETSERKLGIAFDAESQRPRGRA